jgi:ADP-heptose:LPS heptosyltransferase
VPRSAKPVKISKNSSILVSQMGGLGDLALTANLISGLRATFPGAQITLMCQGAFAQIASLYPVPPDKVIELNFSPYAWISASEELREALEPVLEPMQNAQADLGFSRDSQLTLFIAAEFQPTWFSFFLGSYVRPQRAICAAEARAAGPPLAGLLEQLKIERKEFEGPVETAGSHVLERHSEIIRYLGGEPKKPELWTIDRDLEQPVLTGLGLQQGEYLVCFPLGAAGVSVKRWPALRFVETLVEIQARHQIPVLLTGETSEAGDLARIASELGDRKNAIWTGDPQDIATLAALLAGAKAYLGNDTGPMHIAAAYGVPGVAIYGGGHWPVYGPWGKGSTGLVHPLPCFGCGWDCLFGHGLCVESIPVAAAVDALENVLKENGTAPAVVELSGIDEATLALIGDANRRYREAQQDRSERLYSMLEMRDTAELRGGLVSKLEHTAAERLSALEAQNKALELLRKESDRRRDGMRQLTALLEIREGRIEELEKITRERLEALKAESAARTAIEREADRRNEGLAQLTEAIAKRDARIEDLTKESRERLEAVHASARIIEARDRQIRELEASAADRLTALVKATKVIEARESWIGALEKLSEERLQALQKTDEGLKSILVEADKRLEAIQQLTDEIEVRDRRIETAEAIARERLEALELTSAALEDLRAAAEQRLADVHLLTSTLAEREGLLKDAERTGAERLEALNRTHEALLAWQSEAEKRLDAMHQLTAAVAEREARIGGLEQLLQERMEELVSSDASMRELGRRIQDLELSAAPQNDVRIDELKDREYYTAALQVKLEALKLRIDRLMADKAELERQNVAFAKQSVYNFLIRRMRSGSSQPGDDSI